jgi:tyrosine-specific transport protein
MNKKLGSISIVAGTAIGAGMLALPLVLANFGLCLSICVMLSIWILMYYLSLVNLELNLAAGEGLTIAQLGRKFSGPVAESIGLISLKALTYVLLAAYIDGGASVIQKLLSQLDFSDFNYSYIVMAFTLSLILLLVFATKWVDYINRILFFGLIISFVLLLSGLFGLVHLDHLPLLPTQLSLNSWTIALPIVFTSFGFHVVFHSLTAYCNNDKHLLKKVFFWGKLDSGFDLYCLDYEFIGRNFL